MSMTDSLFTDLDDDSRYQSWREQKLAGMPAGIEDYLVTVKDPVRLTAEEHNAIGSLLARANMATVRLATAQIGPNQARGTPPSCMYGWISQTG